MKKRVKMLVAIAGMGDAQPMELAKKYAKTERDLRSKTRTRDGVPTQVHSEEYIAGVVNAAKRKDAAEPRRGFPQDFQFKAGDEALIDAEIAEKWEAAGICVALTELVKKAA